MSGGIGRVTGDGHLLHKSRTGLSRRVLPGVHTPEFGSSAAHVSGPAGVGTTRAGLTPGKRRHLCQSPTVSHDPVTRIASWLTPPTKVDESIDPLLGLITEHKRTIAQYQEVRRHAKEIEAALPENVRQGVPFVIPPGAEPDEPSQTEFFVTEAQLSKALAPWRRAAIAIKRMYGKISDVEAAAEYDDEVAPFLAEFRAGLARNQEIREASGCEALWREYDALVNRSAEIEEQVAGTPAVTLAGLMAQVEFLRDINVRGELFPDWDAIIAGIKNVAK